jgi:hypothetical protein
MEHVLIYQRNSPVQNVNVHHRIRVFNANIHMHLAHLNPVKIWVHVYPMDYQNIDVNVQTDLLEEIARETFMFAIVILAKMEENARNQHRIIIFVNVNDHSMELIVN